MSDEQEIVEASIIAPLLQMFSKNKSRFRTYAEPAFCFSWSNYKNLTTLYQLLTTSNMLRHAYAHGH